MDLYDQAMRFPRQAPARSQPFHYQELRQRGRSAGQIRWRTQSGQWSRPHHGLYLPGSALPALLDLIQAALRCAPPRAVLGFHTAAQLHGFGVTPTNRVHLLIPAGTPFPQRPGIAAHQAVLPIVDIVDVLGLPCAPPARCAIDLARGLRRLDALPVLDAALFANACQPADLLHEVRRHDTLRGVRQARELAPLADARAECRQESQLRLVLHDGGLGDLVPQMPVIDGSGRVRHRVDLGDPEHLIGIEYDGVSHLDRQRLHADRSRHNWLAQRGWLMRYFTAFDLYRQPQKIISTVATARRSRAYRRD